MKIKRAEIGQAQAIVEIYDKAREFMLNSGNPNQWRPGYPSLETLQRDIEQGGSYVCIEEGRIVATFFFVVDDEPTYARIEGGEWLDSDAYGVIHRVASDGTVKGVMMQMLDFCFRQIPNIRIDTHRDNLVMQKNLTRYGFRYCGIIHLANGAERLAFQRHNKVGIISQLG